MKSIAVQQTASRWSAEAEQTDVHTPQLGWPDVYVAHYNFVYNITRRLAGPALDADDLTQEVFVVAVRKLDELQQSALIRSWLYGICRRVVAQHRRKARVRSALLSWFTPTAVHGAIPAADHTLLQHQREQHLYRALNQLSEKLREVIILYALEEMSGNDIAALLDIPLATVWTRLHGARKQLAVLLNEEGSA